MDASLQQILSSFKTGLTMYREKLGESNEVVKKALARYERLEALAAGAKDMMDFYANPDGTAALNELSALMPDLAKEKPLQGIRSVPPSSAVAAGYHLAYDAMQQKDPATVKIYERIFALEKVHEAAPAFLAAMAEEGLFLAMTATPLLAQQPPLRENALRLSQPVMAHFHERTAAYLTEVRSTAELEYQAGLEADLSIYQNLWDQQFLGVTELLLGNAITSWLLSPTEEHRAEVENCYRFTAAFFGVDYDGLMAVPRIRDYVEKIVYESVKKDLAAKGVATLEQFMDGMKQALTACLHNREPVQVGPAANRKLPLWGKETEMNDLERAYRRNFHEGSGRSR